jgi:acetyl-CoA acetyltransferase
MTTTSFYPETGWDLRDRAAIVGVGQTRITRDPGAVTSELASVVDAAVAAVTDAGLTLHDVDGLLGPSYCSSAEEIAANLGIRDLRYSAGVHMGGASTIASLQLAAAAVVCGQARYVLVMEGMHAYSGGRAKDRALQVEALAGIGPPLRDYLGPYGISSPVQWYGLMAHRYMYEFDPPAEALGAVALACRRHAQLNPRAVMTNRPLTMEEYLSSPWVAKPYRVLDCCLETDGAGAVVVAAADDRAVTARRLVSISAVAQGRAFPPDDITNREDLLAIGLTQAAPRAFASAGVGPADIDFAQIYDCFTFEVLQQIEEAGFCERGKAASFVAGGNIELGGSLPVNTAGGLLSEGYLVGIGHLIEAVRQLRHEAGSRQVRCSVRPRDRLWRFL